MFVYFYIIYKVDFFNCSQHFISDFKNSHRFSPRLAHIKRRPDPEPVLDDDGLSSIDKFLLKVSQTIEEAKGAGESAIKGDETCWVILSYKMKTWTITNSSNVIINVKDDEHVHISAMCSITSEFEKHPMFFIPK